MNEYILYYSDKCPDTTDFVQELQDKGIKYQSINITDSMSNLIKFLKLRDGNPAFQEKRERDQVGVPVLVNQAGEIYFELTDLSV